MVKLKLKILKSLECYDVSSCFETGSAFQGISALLVLPGIASQELPSVLIGDVLESETQALGEMSGPVILNEH